MREKGNNRKIVTIGLVFIFKWHWLRPSFKLKSSRVTQCPSRWSQRSLAHWARNKCSNQPHIWKWQVTGGRDKEEGSYSSINIHLVDFFFLFVSHLQFSLALFAISIPVFQFKLCSFRNNDSKIKRFHVNFPLYLKKAGLAGRNLVLS